MIFRPEENLDAVIGMITRMLAASQDVHWWSIYPAATSFPEPCNNTVGLRVVVAQILESTSDRVAIGDLWIGPGEDAGVLEERFREVVADLARLAKETGLQPVMAAPRASEQVPWGDLLSAEDYKYPSNDEWKAASMAALKENMQ
jgi:hypothetical protein